MLLNTAVLFVVGFSVGLSAGSSVPPKHPAYRSRWDTFDTSDTDFAPLDDGGGAAQELRYRLPSYIVPTHYDLYIESLVHTGNRSYSGWVDIRLDVRQQARTIYVHNRGVRITASDLLLYGEDANTTFIEELRYVEDVEREFVVFSIRRVLDPNQYVLHLEFDGTLRTDDDGFYLSSYRQRNGTTQYLAATQFQAISARAAFPCLDEPALKATISLQIKHHPSYQAVSNMPIFAIAGDLDGNVVTVFETTPRMSIYLLAFMVSNFPYVEDLDSNQRVFARPTAIEQTQYALEAGIRILDVLDAYTGLPYGSYMPKVDQVALPDFFAGAMENWGLCNYREEYLLYEPGVSSYRTRTFITTIVAHEYAHQWFGNLITNAWWSYLWLNEGFASLYEYMAADMAYPERGYRELFNVEVVQRALVTDGSEGTRPMTYSRGATFGAIVSLFDNIAYSKGGSVLQMFRQVISDPVWRQVIRLYVDSNQFEAVRTEQLVDAMIEVTQDLDYIDDVEQFVRSWVDQPGFPVLEVRRTYRGDILLSQDRFYNNRVVNDDRSVWIIPFQLLEQGDSLSEPLEWHWLNTRASRQPSNAANDNWLLANVHQTGFYRVNYDLTNWYLLIAALTESPQDIPLQSRAQLVDDSFYLARSNRLDMEVALDLLTYLRAEREYPPWAAASRVFAYFNDRMRGHPDYILYQLFVDTLIGDVYVTLDVTTVDPDETLLHKYLRQMITTWACRMEIESCLTETREALDREVTGEEMVHPDVAEVVYCYGLRTGSTATSFPYLLDKLQASFNRAERSSLINALGCSVDAEQLNTYLLTAIESVSEMFYDEEERYYVLTSVLVSRAGVDALIDFLAVNHPSVVSVLGQGTLNSLVQSIASRTNTPAEELMLNGLLQQLDSVLPAGVVTNVRSVVSNNLAWPSSREGVLLNYFLQSYRPIPV